MLNLLATAYISVASSVPTAASAAQIEMNCGGQFTQPSQVIECLSQARENALAQIDAAQQRLEHHLQQIPARYANLGELNIATLRRSWQDSQNAWQEFAAADCAYYEQLHSAIWEGDMERASCLLRATVRRLNEVSANESFWREKFPLAD